jgi:hypothetical protein
MRALVSASSSKLSNLANGLLVTVNVVSTFLLALLLLPKLQETAKTFSITPTLTIVSSEVHGLTPVSVNSVAHSCRADSPQLPEKSNPSIFETLNDVNTAKMNARYNTSKLLEVLACRELVKKHPVSQTKVTINFVSKYWPATGLFCHGGF